MARDTSRLKDWLDKTKETVVNKPLSIGWYLAITVAEIALLLLDGRCL